MPVDTIFGVAIGDLLGLSGLDSVIGQTFGGGASTPVFQEARSKREGAGTATVTVDISTMTLSAGDLLIAVASTSTAATTWSNSAGGMTERSDGPTAVYSKISDGTETSLSFVCSLDSGAKGAVVVRITGGAYDNVAVDETAVGAVGTETVMPTVSATNNTSLWLEIGIHQNSITDPENWTAPDGSHTKHTELLPGNNFRAMVGSKPVNSGATGTATWTHSSSGSDKRAASIIIAPS